MSLLNAMLLEPYPLEVWIVYRTDGIKGSGTLSDPWDGSTDTKFDAIMSSLPANTPVRIHLGPTPRDSNNNPNVSLRFKYDELVTQVEDLMLLCL